MVLPLLRLSLLPLGRLTMISPLWIPIIIFSLIGMATIVILFRKFQEWLFPNTLPENEMYQGRL